MVKPAVCASGRPAPADAQPVQQHGARSGRRLQPARRSLSAGGLRRRLQESDADAEHPAGARRRIQHRCRAHCAECVPCGRCQRPRSLPAFASSGGSRQSSRKAERRRHGARREMPRSVRARVWREGVPASVERASKYGGTTICSPTQAGRTGKFLEGARVVVEAMLQSPKFLFHVTAGDPSVRLKPDTTEAGSGGTGSVRLQADQRRLQADQRDYAIANRLSYLLWDTMPDRALLDAAAKGELRTSEGLERVARTMLQDTRARQATDEFFSQWLRFDRMLTAAKDDGRYPSFTPELAAMMVQETRMLLGHLVWNDRNFMEALTADYSFLNADLARLYGLPEPAGEFEMVKFPEALPRAGILGQATFLASTTGPGRDVSHRAWLVRARTSAVSDRAEPATRREHEPARAGNRRCRAREARAHARARDESLVLGLSSPDGSHRVRARKVRRRRRAGATRKSSISMPARANRGGASQCRSTSPRRAKSPGWRTRRSAIRARLAACWRRALSARIAWSSRCFAMRSAGPRRRRTGRRSTGTAAAFRSSGFKFKEMLISLVRSPQFLEGL